MRVARNCCRSWAEVTTAKPLVPKPIPRDLTHPLYHERICHMYRDHNVLLKGLDQGKILTKTVEIKTGLPVEIENLLGVHCLPDQDILVQRCILKSHVFDAMQVKLPKIRDPQRPAWNFPRGYGITDKRRTNLLSPKLIQLCEFACGNSTDAVLGRAVVQDETVFVPFEKDGDLIQLELTVNFMLNSAAPLPLYADADEVQGTQDIPLPDLYPIKHTITLEKENIYQIRNVFPVLKGSKFPYIHTAIFHCNETEVKNIYETPVTEEQVQGRTLLKSFAVAAAHAQQRFGVNVKDLPEPITVQCVQTDGRLFHFAVFQLNTLDLDGTEGKKNIFWMLPRIPLFTSCMYVKGRPLLEGYNSEVFSRLLAFCSNGLPS
ncbi:39S ribosomal protein L37, mitochondrial isoform X2 [Zootermopsis nevadensis]|uniref:39S ribosomal protein L37, mitochondrial isoform X2 n=1 Tax=Zootermopsis nevadensis TaxID=136037 RepID=UPI000B8E96D7|nr:39S ribosomal protein L37, mitochondrial isoform X2 [Zootermopsis nevadensis]